MKKITLPGCILLLAMAGVAIAGSQGQFLGNSGLEPLTASYQNFNEFFTGDDWQRYGQLFTDLQQHLFPRLFLLMLTTIPVIFFFHYIAVGPMVFDHGGKQIYCYSLFVRIVHWCTALSFTLLVITGLITIFSKLTGGGTFGILVRNVHLVSSVISGVSAICMFVLWFKDMLPALYDIKWIFIMGGYLSKELKPVPAGKFNAGQKMWFWLATLGGAAMAVTGYFLFLFEAHIDTLRISIIVHNFLGAAIMAMFLVHIYMSMVAVKGSLKSMITGNKAEAELKILHPRFKY